MNTGFIQSAAAQQRQRRQATLRACFTNRHAKGTQGETARAWVPILIAALRNQGPTVRAFTATFNERVNALNA